MADTLIDSEVLGVWERIRAYLDLSSITSVDKMNMQAQLKEVMERPAKNSSDFPDNMDTLVEHNFPSEFISKPQIRNELLEKRIKAIKIRGVTRYQATAGTRDGKALGGIFLKGKTMEEAITDLSEKGSQKKARRITYKRRMGY